jgi:hypothetical protein
VRRAIVYLLAAIAIGAGYYALDRTPAATPDVAPIQWLYAASQDDIERVVIAIPGRTIAFVKKPDGWVVDGPGAVPVDMARWSAIPLLLSGTTVARRLAKIDDPSAYGLDDPLLIVDVYLRGDRRIQVQMGDPTPDGENNYVALAGLDGVSLVNAAWGRTLVALATNPPYQM